jgi:hypothetical protein
MAQPENAVVSTRSYSELERIITELQSNNRDLEYRLSQMRCVNDIKIIYHLYV